MELHNVTDSTSKKFKANVAELTRPARQLNEKFKARIRKPSGRKRKHEPRPAKYHNWLTPFCWTDVVIVTKQVGWRMSASEIANGLKRRNPDTFGKINRNTIEGWIDRSGAKPKWKDSVLRRVDDGNNPGHNKGGQRGILVRPRFLIQLNLTTSSRLNILRLSKQLKPV